MLQFWAGNSLVDTTSHNLMEVGEIFRLKGHAISSGGEALLVSEWEDALFEVTFINGLKICVGSHHEFKVGDGKKVVNELTRYDRVSFAPRPILNLNLVEGMSKFMGHDRSYLMGRSLGFKVPASILRSSWESRLWYLRGVVSRFATVYGSGGSQEIVLVDSEVHALLFMKFLLLLSQSVYLEGGIIHLKELKEDQYWRGSDFLVKSVAALKEGLCYFIGNKGIMVDGVRVGD